MTASARREQLLDVTTKLVIGGFQRVSVEAIAQRAGVARSLVYKHFAGADALLENVVEREMARAPSQVSETTLSDLTQGGARDLMLESRRAYLNVVLTHPITWRLVLMAPDGAPETLRELIAERRAAVLAP